MTQKPDKKVDARRQTSAPSQAAVKQADKDKKDAAAPAHSIEQSHLKIVSRWKT